MRHQVIKQRIKKTPEQERRPAASSVLVKHPVYAVGLLLVWCAFILINYYWQLWRLLLRGGWSLPDFHGDLRLPYFFEAASRAMISISLAALLVYSAVLLGLFLFRLLGWRFSGTAEVLPFAASAGIGIFAYLGLALAAVGLYHPSILLILACLPLLGAAIQAARKRPGAVFQRLKASLSLHHPGGLRKDSLWMVVVFTAAGMSLVAALAPEWEYDALWYHLQYPRLYLENGRLVDNPTDYVSLYPMTWELWYGYALSAGWAATRSLTSGVAQTTATLLHFAALPFTAAAILQTTRRFAPGASPWLAAALFATIPTIMWEASTAYVDLALALYTCLTLYSLLKYTQERSSQWLALGILNLGLALATKHLALFVMLLAGLGFFLKLFLAERKLSPAGRPALLLSLALLPALPWYLRSFLATGNPFFPELFSLFGSPAGRWDAVTQAGLQVFLDSFGRPRSLSNLLTLPWHMTIHAASYHGSLGPVFLIFLPVLLAGRLRGALPWLAGFAVLFVGLWASPFSSLQMRFMVAISPVLAVLCAAAISRTAAFSRLAFYGRPTLQRMVKTGILGLTAVLLFLNMPPFTALHERDRIGWEGWLNSVLHGVEWGVVVGSESREDYLSRKLRSYPVWSFANHSLPEGARVLTWTGGDQFYSRHERIWAYATVARPVAWAPIGPDRLEAAAILPDLESLGITHIIADIDFKQRLEGSSGWENWFGRLYQDNHFSLYRIRWEAVP